MQRLIDHLKTRASEYARHHKLKASALRDQVETVRRKKGYNPEKFNAWWAKLQEEQQRQTLVEVLLENAGVKNRAILRFKKRLGKLGFTSKESESRRLYNELVSKMEQVQSGWRVSRTHVEERCLELSGNSKDIGNIIFASEVIDRVKTDMVVRQVNRLYYGVEMYYTQPLSEYRAEKKKNKLQRRNDPASNLVSLQLLKQQTIKSMQEQYRPLLMLCGRIRNKIKQIGVWNLVSEQVDLMFYRSKRVMELCHKLMVMDDLGDNRSQDGLAWEHDEKGGHDSPIGGVTLGQDD